MTEKNALADALDFFNDRKGAPDAGAFTFMHQGGILVKRIEELEKELAVKDKACEMNREWAEALRAELSALKAPVPEAEAQEAYGRAFHCGSGGHDGHIELPPGQAPSPDDLAWADRCTLAVAWKQARAEVERLEKCLLSRGDTALRAEVKRIGHESWLLRVAADHMADLNKRAESLLQESQAQLAVANAKLDAISSTDGKAREVVKDLLGMNPDAGERMWFETSQRLMSENESIKAKLERSEEWIKIQEIQSAERTRENDTLAEKVRKFENDFGPSWRNVAEKAEARVRGLEAERPDWLMLNEGELCLKTLVSLRTQVKALEGKLKVAVKIARHTSHVAGCDACNFKGLCEEAGRLYDEFDEDAFIASLSPAPEAEPRVYDKPCFCREMKGSEPGHIHASQPAPEGK